MPHVTVLLLFEGCDVMDTTGPYEVFLTANRLAVREGAPAVFSVRTVTLDGRPVTAYGGLGLVPSHGDLTGQEAIDILVVPGLVDVDAGVGNDVLLAALASAADRAGLVTSVCTGAFLLHAAGVLGDHEATTHWEDVPALASLRASGNTRDDVRWVDAGDVVTAGGLTDGIGMALHLVERFAGRDLAERTARQLDFPWSLTRDA